MKFTATKEEILTTVAIMVFVVASLFCAFNYKAFASSDSVTFNTPSNSAWGDVQKNTDLTDAQIEKLKELSATATPWCSTVYR
jgi:hypothetical protein